MPGNMIRDIRDIFPAVASKHLLDAPDRIALLVEEAIDPPREVHVVGAIVTAVACTLQRPQLRELGLPVTQDVLGDSQLGGKLADGQKSAGSFLDARHCGYFAILSRRI